MQEQIRFIFEKRDTPVDLDAVLYRLRNRSLLLRVQAAAFMAVIALISITLIVFLATRSHSYGGTTDARFSVAPSEEATQRSVFEKLEQQHVDMSTKIENYAQTAIQEAENEEAELSQRAKEQARLIKIGQIAQDLRDAKRDLIANAASEREAMTTEVRKAREERDKIAREAAERLTLIRLIGEAAFRVGAIVVSVYFMSILANISKYWFRVADHLSAVADTLEALAAANLSLEKGIHALSPHPIDFQAEEPMSLKTVKDLLSVTPVPPRN